MAVSRTLACLVVLAVSASVPAAARRLNQATGLAGGCQCTGSNDGVDFGSAPYNWRDHYDPRVYGKFCRGWEHSGCASMWEDGHEAWCCDPWCFVNSTTCLDAIASSEHPGLYISYQTCAHPDSDAVEGRGAGYDGKGSCPWQCKLEFVALNSTHHSWSCEHTRTS